MSPEQSSGNEHVNKLYETRFDVNAKRLVDDIEHSSTSDAILASSHYLQNILAEAQEGKIVSSKDKVPYSDEQIFQGIKNLRDERLSTEPVPEDERINLPSSGGLRSAFEKLFKDPQSFQAISGAIDAIEEGRKQDAAAAEGKFNNGVVAVEGRFGTAPEVRPADAPGGRFGFGTMPVGEDLTHLMGAGEARNIVNIEASELEPKEREKIEAELAEEALEETVVAPEEYSPWSPEAAQQKNTERTEGTRENPYLLDIDDVSFNTSVNIDGKSVRATTTSYYFDENGERQYIFGPANSSDAPLFEGKTITKSYADLFSSDRPSKMSEHLEHQNDRKLQETVADLSKEPISSNEESGNAMSMDEFRQLINERPDAKEIETPLTKDEYLEKLTDGLTNEDKDSLQVYADTVMMLEGAQKRSERDNVAYWKREVEKATRSLSLQARAIADQYAHAYLHY